MKIGELAKLSGMAPSRIRFYEAQGLIKAVDRGANGYREYPKEALLTLEIIAAAKRGGFSLKEVRALLPDSAGKWNRDEMLNFLEMKAAEIAALQDRLNRTRNVLVQLIGFIKGRPESDCLDNARAAVDMIYAAAPRRKA